MTSGVHWAGGYYHLILFAVLNHLNPILNAGWKIKKGIRWAWKHLHELGTIFCEL